jgi:hypothetical protein
MVTVPRGTAKRYSRAKSFGPRALVRCTTWYSLPYWTHPEGPRRAVLYRGVPLGWYAVQGSSHAAPPQPHPQSSARPDLRGGDRNDGRRARRGADQHQVFAPAPSPKPQTTVSASRSCSGTSGMAVTAISISTI